MLTTLEVENFKCLAHFEQHFGALTLLTGFNASGKSSVAQVFALLRQTAIDNEWSRALQLNGSSVQLGTMYDVIDRNSGGSGFRVGFRTDRWYADWLTTSSDRKRELAASLCRIRIKAAGSDFEWVPDLQPEVPVRRLVPEFGPAELTQLFQEMREKLASISFVGAERIGPREVYVAQSPLLYAEVGAQGEKTPWCLEQFADAEINPALCLPGVPNLLRLTVQAWMAQLFPGFQLEIKRVDATNLITVGVRTSPRGDFFRPVNVGFGLTHVLPIVTACVAARPGRIVVVENPESHLHPAGQSLIGFFLALAASGGVQIIVETHSDHVLNGVRRAVRDKRLLADMTKVYFFRSETGAAGEALANVEPVAIDSAGRITGWPVGFFDQMESDLDYIFRD